MAEKLAPKKRDWSWRSQAFRGIIYQLIAVGLLGFAVWWLATNTLENMRLRGIQSGFGFLLQPAGFDIGESIIEFDSANPYWKAFLVGLTNTLRVGACYDALSDITPRPRDQRIGMAYISPPWLH